MKHNKPPQREPKKTVSIEVRVSEEDKHAFWEACRSANRPASAVLRHLMEVFVAFRNLRQRVFAMFDHIIRKPISATLGAFACAAALSMSLMLAPSAAADVRLIYQVVVDDGVGQIVSEGQAEFGQADGADAAISDTLGDGIRYSFAASPCIAGSTTACAEGQTVIVFSLWEAKNGELTRATDSGIAVSPTDETRFQTALSDGRVLTVLFLPQA
ncbi:hypothetical protein [Hyphobacterium sp.]|uniref:hypothetical protein n=1 Tax=Hyphobacterium sp. TaxID=2004662 RepID=UPI003BAB5847